MLLESLSNYDDDDNVKKEKKKQNNWFYEKNNGSTRASRLVHFFDVHCTTTTWNLPMRRFMEDVDIRGQVFLSLLEHG